MPLEFVPANFITLFVLSAGTGLKADVTSPSTDHLEDILLPSVCPSQSSVKYVVDVEMIGALLTMMVFVSVTAFALSDILAVILKIPADVGV